MLLIGRSKLRTGSRMNLMRATQRARGFCSAVAAFALAIALLAGSVCGPACSGALCPANSTTAKAKPSCHGMSGRAGNSLSASALLQSCNFADANVATERKPSTTLARAIRAPESSQFVNAADSLQVASDQIVVSLTRLKDSPPNFRATSIATVVLRV